MGKNIVIFSDGTGQIGGKNYNTNVYKLFNMVEDRTKRQVAFYDPGLGTDWHRITGNIFGRGFSKNLMDCYHFIFQNYEAGDEVYLFGFSRGAATVRSVSGFIHLFGILPKCREDLLREAFSIYRIADDEKRKDSAKAFVKRNHTMWCKIRFLGVWDTVAALGLPTKLLSVLFDKIFPSRFHSFKLSKSVAYARQALSIDDERKTFHPILWDPLEPSDPEDRMKQVWFCGVHTDVGGGYKEVELSNISLQWMVKEATAKGLLLYKDGDCYKDYINDVCDANGIMHDEQLAFPGTMFKRMQRSWDVSKHGNPCIHGSVKMRIKNSRNLDTPPYTPWIAQFKDATVEPWVKDE